MSDDVNALKASELRAAFDQSFANEVVSAREAHEELLLVRTRNNHIALRANETAGIHRCPPLTSVPSRSTALCGLAGVRGSLVAVYSIAALLGESREQLSGAWIVLCTSDRSAALLFDELEGYARVDAKEILQATPSHELAIPARELVHLDGVRRAVIPLSDLLKTVTRVGGSELQKE